MPQEKKISEEIIIEDNILISIVSDDFTDRETGKVIPYYQIFTKSPRSDKPLQWKPNNTQEFGANLEKFRKFQGKAVRLILDYRQTKTGVALFIKDIIPVL